MNATTLAAIRSARILPVVVIDDASRALDLADALLAAGLHAIEITFRTATAPQAIATIARQAHRAKRGLLPNLRLWSRDSQNGNAPNSPFLQPPCRHRIT